MNYIVFDLEFNQAYRCATNKLLKQEIIEIGAVKVDENFNVIDEFRHYINPKLFKQINPFVQAKTNITMSRLREHGLPFPQVMQEFLDWLEKDYILCSWGIDDIRELKNNCLFYDIDIEWIQKFIDIQLLYSVTNPSEKRQVKLKQAIVELDIPHESAFHTAIVDAFYTMEVFRNIYNPAKIVINNFADMIFKKPQARHKV
jgi:inhibitor of KinA sporulation pathway (predicted exonuclease)